MRTTDLPTLILIVTVNLIHWPLSTSSVSKEECQLRPVIHVIQHPGCVPKPIPSFACHGTCSSYVQVSGSKFWQVERSCMCCQEMGEREATIAIFCPKQVPKFRKIVTRAPVECMCRPCTGVDPEQVKPLELANIVNSDLGVDGDSVLAEL